MTSLGQFLAREGSRLPTAAGDPRPLLNGIALGCRRISALLARGAIGVARRAAASHGPFADVLTVTDEIFMACAHEDGAAALTSPRMEQPCTPEPGKTRKRFLVAFASMEPRDPFSGDAPGSIFSILPAPEDVNHPAAEDFLQSGVHQICAGYCLYAAATVLVLTLGSGVHGFTLDPDRQEFVLTHPAIRAAAHARTLVIDRRDGGPGEPGVDRYLRERLGHEPAAAVLSSAGTAGSFAAAVHGVLLHAGMMIAGAQGAGGEDPTQRSLLFEANPMALLVENAGGAASTGDRRIMEVDPAAMHQRIPVVLGPREEVECLERCLAAERPAAPEPASPLFKERSLFTRS